LIIWCSLIFHVRQVKLLEYLDYDAQPAEGAALDNLCQKHAIYFCWIKA